jgi:hypothetical protein
MPYGRPKLKTQHRHECELLRRGPGHLNSYKTYRPWLSAPFLMLSIFASLILTATLGRAASQVPLNDFWVQDRAGRVIDEELSSYIQNQMEAGNITGLSLGIVLPNGEVEFGAWGNRTEAGDLVRPEVRLPYF